MQKELWKPVVGYEGLYEASDQGRIKRIKGSLLLTIDRSHKQGYLRVKLRKGKRQKNYAVHRLVLSAFTGESELTVNHKNEIKTDNRLCNLEWKTMRDNHLEYYTTGRDKKFSSKYRGVSWRRDRGKWAAQKLVDGRMIHIGRYDTELEAYHAFVAFEESLNS